MWTGCTVTCGPNGNRQRHVHCHNDQTDKKVDERHCRSDQRPLNVTTCDRQPACADWSVGEWREVSVPTVWDAVQWNSSTICGHCSSMCKNPNYMLCSKLYVGVKCGVVTISCLRACVLVAVRVRVDTVLRGLSSSPQRALCERCDGRGRKLLSPQFRSGAAGNLLQFQVALPLVVGQ